MYHGNGNDDFKYIVGLRSYSIICLYQRLDQIYSHRFNTWSSLERASRELS